MSTDLDASHYGEEYTVDELESITGKSARTFRRWRDAGLLEKVGNNPLTYLVLDPEENTSLKSIDLTLVNKNLFNNSPSDVTEEVEEYGSVDAFLDAVEIARSKIEIIHKPNNSKAMKILSLSDLHVPFHNEKLIKEIMDEHSDADMCVLNGDIVDAYGASSYSQDKLVTISKEYNIALDIIRYASQKFPKVLLIRGNHDQRVDRYFSKKIDPHMFALAQRDILWRLANGYVYDRNGKHIGTVNMDNVIYNPGGQPWFAQVGRTVFMHPHSYGSKQMATVCSAQVHLENFIDRDSYDSIVIGHTHKVGKIVEKGKLLIEQGCLCDIMDYQKEGRYITRPQTVGYAVIYQDEKGNTNFNDSTYVYKGVLNTVK